MFGCRAGDDLGLAAEARAAPRRCRERQLEELDREALGHAQVARLVDAAHAALGDEALDPIGLDQHRRPTRSTAVIVDACEDERQGVRVLFMRRLSSLVTAGLAATFCGGCFPTGASSSSDGGTTVAFSAPTLELTISGVHFGPMAPDRAPSSTWSRPVTATARDRIDLPAVGVDRHRRLHALVRYLRRPRHRRRSVHGAGGAGQRHARRHRLPDHAASSSTRPRAAPRAPARTATARPSS